MAVAVVLFLVGVRMFDGMGEMKATQTTPFGYIGRIGDGKGEGLV